MSDSTHLSVSRRLERLPNQGYLTNLAAIIIISVLFTVFVNNGFQYLMPSIAEEFGLGPAVMGKLASLSFWGMFVGAILGGFLADKLGRKPIILAAMVIWGVAGLVLSFSTAVITLQVCRFLIGFALGAQLPTAQVAMSELVPSRVRGKYMVSYMVALPLGMVAVGLLTYVFLPRWGWHGVAMIEGLVALFGFVYWKYFPESALWLESRGRHEEADKVMDKIEAAIEKCTGQPLPPIDVTSAVVSEQEKMKDAQVASIFSRPYIGLVALMTIYMLCQMMGFYGINMWLSSLLVLKGFTITKSVLYVSLISLGGVPAFFLMSYLVEKAGRKWSVVIMAVATAIGAYIYGQATTLSLVIATGLLYMFMQFGYNMASAVFTVELWPTNLRGAGKGYAQAWGRVGSALGPIVIGYILAAGMGHGAVMLFAVAINLLAAIVVLIFAPETRGKVF